MARVTAAHDMPTNMTTSATGPHLSSYRALGSRRAIRLARHTNIHSEYTMKTMATGARKRRYCEVRTRRPHAREVVPVRKVSVY